MLLPAKLLTDVIFSKWSF